MNALPWLAARPAGRPGMRPSWRLVGLGGVCAIVGGCATSPAPTPAPVEPPQDPPPAPVVVLPPEPTPYELRQRERAQALARQGRLAEAALIWEMLATIRPKAQEYRDRLAEVQKQIEGGVAERMQRGDQATARGQLEAAMQHYLSALALQPDNARAADALRGVERERVRRTHLGKLSRNTLTRRAMSEAEMAPNDSPLDAVATPGPSTPGPTTKATGIEERNEVEHASLLASQGEFDEAIAMLERRLRANRRDDAARELLADVYFQKAESLGPRSRTAAVALLERSVRLDPRHPKAPERLRQWRPAPPAAAAPAAPGAPATAAPTPTTPPPGTPAATRPPVATGAAPGQPGALKPAAAVMSAPAASAAAPAAPRR